jgi:hypothetical protein
MQQQHKIHSVQDDKITNASKENQKQKPKKSNISRVDSRVCNPTFSPFGDTNWLHLRSPQIFYGDRFFCSV